MRALSTVPEIFRDLGRTEGMIADLKTDEKAVKTLLRDWDRRVTFFSFSHEHWQHLRATNIVELLLSSVRLRMALAGTSEWRGPKTSLIHAFSGRDVHSITTYD